MAHKEKEEEYRKDKEKEKTKKQKMAHQETMAHKEKEGEHRKDREKEKRKKEKKKKWRTGLTAAGARPKVVSVPQKKRIRKRQREKILYRTDRRW